MEEDVWHAYTGLATDAFVRRFLDGYEAKDRRLLNAGAGVYELCLRGWDEISLDLFTTPLCDRRGAVCGRVEALPFATATFGAIVCVGEVLAYCDPAAAIAEFARVLDSDGALIVDFGSSRSIRRWFSNSFGRAADLVSVEYNGTPEQTWVYDPAYVRALLGRGGFDIRAEQATHTWSALARTLGVSTTKATTLERRLSRLSLPRAWGDLRTIGAVRSKGGR